MAAEGFPYIRIYTDEDVLPSLASALRQRGYVAESAHESGMLGRSDIDQLSYASEHGMAILTFNVADFAALAADWFAQGREHAGIILSEQMDRQRFGDLLRQVLKLLDTLTADDLYNGVVYLQHFR
jgi:predicted nuclease of predicted toxin-antitoxin system